MESPSPNNASHGWRGILEGRKVLRKGLGWIIGNGESVSVWNTPWLATNFPLCPMGPPKLSTVSLMVKDLLLPNSTKWNQEVIMHHLPHHVEDIFKIVLSSAPKPDKLRWLPTKAGSYTAKSGYEVCKGPEFLEQPGRFNWETNIWKLGTSPKLKMFVWKVARNALPTGFALSTRGMLDGLACQRCGEVEDGVHLFFNCPFAKRVWALAPVLRQHVTGRQEHVQQLLAEARTLINLPPIGLGPTPLFPWLLWFLWKARNSLLFEDKGWSEKETIQKAISEAKSWHLAKLMQPKKVSQRRQANEVVHDEAFTCFSDASWLKSSYRCGMGWSIKDPMTGLIRNGSSSRPYVSSALMAEALALKAAITAALALGAPRLACFSDCQELVVLLKTEGHALEIDGIIDDIRSLLFSFLSV